MRGPASLAIMSYKVTPDGCSHVNILFVGSTNLASNGVDRGRSRDYLGIRFEDLIAVGFFGFVVARLGECGFLIGGLISDDGVLERVADSQGQGARAGERPC